MEVLTFILIVTIIVYGIAKGILEEDTKQEVVVKVVEKPKPLLIREPAKKKEEKPEYETFASYQRRLRTEYYWKYN